MECVELIDNNEHDISSREPAMLLPRQSSAYRQVYA